MSRCSAIATFLILCGVNAGQQKPRQELETGKPVAIILPPPVLIEAKVERDRMVVKFRELGLERVVRYNLYRFEAERWTLLGSAAHSPLELEGCAAKRAVYGLTAVDESETVGDRRTFEAAVSCAKVKPPPRR